MIEAIKKGHSPFDEIQKNSFRFTPLGTKVVIYHLVGNVMLKSMNSIVSLGTCAEILQTRICKEGVR